MDIGTLSPTMQKWLRGEKMAKPISVSMRFNGDTEITLIPTEAKDKELLAHAVRGNRVCKISVGEDGSVKFQLIPEGDNYVSSTSGGGIGIALTGNANPK